MQHDFKVGDKVRVLNNSYTQSYGSKPGEIDSPGNLVYITYVSNGGCKLAFDKDHDPYSHSSTASLFFSYGEFEHVA